MEISIQKWGNSAAMRLPAEILKQLKVSHGDKLAATVTPDGLLLKPKRPSYKLADLIAQCDPGAPRSPEIEAWEKMPSVGREV